MNSMVKNTVVNNNLNLGYQILTCSLVDLLEVICKKHNEKSKKYHNLHKKMND